MSKNLVGIDATLTFDIFDSIFDSKIVQIDRSRRNRAFYTILTA